MCTCLVGCGAEQGSPSGEWLELLTAECPCHHLGLFFTSTALNVSRGEGPIVHRGNGSRYQGLAAGHSIGGIASSSSWSWRGILVRLSCRLVAAKTGC